jgi:hypothetical protein
LGDYSGDFTYSISNKVFSTPKPQPSDESLFSIIEKHFTFEFPELKEEKPEPFDKFVMDHDYFTCYIPASWKLERDKESDEKNGIFEMKLTVRDKAKPEDGDKYFLPDPAIYVIYYTKNNNKQMTYNGVIIVMNAGEGFYMLSYTSPREFYNQYLPVFEEVTKTFKSLYQ